jgi:signal transduction histidine kinase
MLDNIFNRFTQVEGSLIRRKEGTGIGLSLVKCLVEMHGGCIEAKSEVGVGSEFLFTIPVHTVEDYYQTNMEISKQLGGKIESNVEKLNIEFSDIYSV